MGAYASMFPGGGGGGAGVFNPGAGGMMNLGALLQNLIGMFSKAGFGGMNAPNAAGAPPLTGVPRGRGRGLAPSVPGAPQFPGGEMIADSPAQGGFGGGMNPDGSYKNYNDMFGQYGGGMGMVPMGGFLGYGGGFGGGRRGMGFGGGYGGGQAQGPRMKAPGYATESDRTKPVVGSPNYDPMTGKTTGPVVYGMRSA